MFLETLNFGLWTLDFGLWSCGWLFPRSNTPPQCGTIIDNHVQLLWPMYSDCQGQLDVCRPRWSGYEGNRRADLVSTLVQDGKGFSQCLINFRSIDDRYVYRRNK